jgi:trehalose 6-phosphate phosphatase
MTEQLTARQRSILDYIESSLRERGYPTLLVCSGSEEQERLHELADVVVDGPAGVLDLLRELTQDIRRARA